MIANLGRGVRVGGRGRHLGAGYTLLGVSRAERGRLGRGRNTVLLVLAAVSVPRPEVGLRIHGAVRGARALALDVASVRVVVGP